MQARGRPNRVTKPPSAPRRPINTSRRIDEDQLAAHFENAQPQPSHQHHGNTVVDEVMGDGDGGAGDGDDSFAHHRTGSAGEPGNEAEAEAGSEADHQNHRQQHHHHHDSQALDHDHGHDQAPPPHAHVDDAMDHAMAPMAPMAPMTPTQHPHQSIDDLAASPSLLQDDGPLHFAAAAAATAADLQPPTGPPPVLSVGSTMPAPQPLVAATDFQPNPLPPAPPPPPPPPQQQQQQRQQQSQQHHHHHHHQQAPQQTPQSHPNGASSSSASNMPPASPPVRAPMVHHRQPQHTQHSSPHHPHQHHHQHHQQSTPEPPLKTTEELALESGYEDFKVDSAFAKRMSRDPGQRLAEQRRHGQDLNLVRRSNVEALFAQIAGTEAANPCTHCRKGQGPWTVCVVYNGQMMGSCANCWFNASGSRCSFHEKSQPLQPAAHPYAVPVAIPPGATADPTGGGVVGAGGSAAVGSGFVAGTSPAQLQAAALWNASGALFSHDAGVKGTVQSALMQVRQATPYQRALIEVEVAAKQLALKIVEAEEIASGLGLDEGVDSVAPSVVPPQPVVAAEDEEQNGDGGGGHQHILTHGNGKQGVHEYDSPPGDDDMADGGL
ncbi:hypothetical protein BD289DRAFT_472655 [Coniella lustricola]|uniref:Uncharacterized protein n=1 Tax=Coniella lustricola TaxID=2025994 RepID=A0A2T3AEL0_9PEZI|nr:hypothetical protein BD289DRAFT_472655 [Coniella lustricola]